jgi:hypothetical protein
MQSLFAAARRKSFRWKSICLVRLACVFDTAAIQFRFRAARAPSGQSAQITATPWPGPIPQLRRKIKANPAIEIGAFR